MWHTYTDNRFRQLIRKANNDVQKENDRLLWKVVGYFFPNFEYRRWARLEDRAKRRTQAFNELENRLRRRYERMFDELGDALDQRKANSAVERKAKREPYAMKSRRKVSIAASSAGFDQLLLNQICQEFFTVEVCENTMDELVEILTFYFEQL